MYTRVANSCVRFATSQQLAVATMRRKRLNKEPNHWGQAVFLDLLFGAGPWVVGTCLVALALWAIHENVDGAPSTYKRLDAPVAIGAISTFSAFLLVSKIQANLACNSTIITEFSNLTGSLINLALWVKSQMVDGKRAVETLDLPDGSGGCFQANRIGMTLASVPYAVKYVGRGVDIMPEGLPLGQDPNLVNKYKEYTAKGQVGADGGHGALRRAGAHARRADRPDPARREEGQRVRRALCAAQRGHGRRGLHRRNVWVQPAVHPRRAALRRLHPLPGCSRSCRT